MWYYFITEIMSQSQMEDFSVVPYNFLQGLRSIGYQIKKEDLEAKFKQIVEE